MAGWMQQLTSRGYALGEVISALQKSIRRGDEGQATWWAAEMDRSGHSTHLWNRLEVVCSEDVGLGWPEGPAVIQALRQQWERTVAKRNPHRPERLYVMHAVALLARAPKSRRMDEALWVNYGTEEAKYPIPDYALDMHTARGRQMGRGVEHFEAEAAKLENELSLDDDPYGETYRAMFSTNEREAAAEAAYGLQWTNRGRSPEGKGPQPEKLF